MTPYNLVNMAKLKGLDIIALTDHNTCKNCPAAIKAGEEAGIVVVPGMELCTSEEVHIICLFGELKEAMNFSAYVEQNIIKIKNREDIFGEQLVMDSKDNITGKIDYLLTTASNISVSNVVQTVNEFGGICYPAHIDRKSYSVISNLGSITSEMGFSAAEISNNGNLEDCLQKYPILRSMRIMNSSDAHSLEMISEAEKSIELEECSARGLIKLF